MLSAKTKREPEEQCYTEAGPPPNLEPQEDTENEILTEAAILPVKEMLRTCNI